MNTILKPYKKDCDYSYTSGAYATIELLKAAPTHVMEVHIHSRYHDPTPVERLCKNIDVPIVHGDKGFQRINEKENSYVLGVFSKYDAPMKADRPHVVLVNPADMGNLGTIIRTITGFGLRDLAIISPAADLWNPKTIRASMGAFFGLRFSHFDSFGDYSHRFPHHHCFPFMLDGTLLLSHDSCPREPLYSIIFGNEATGLDPWYHQLGTSVRIDHSTAVDSLNLSIAVGIGAYLFTNVNANETVGLSP